MTDGGFPIRCEICGASSVVDVSRPPGDSVCPVCGTFLWVDALVEIASRNGFVPDVRLSEVLAHTRTEAIYAVVDAIAEELRWTGDQSARLTCSILARESLGTTGIGRGLAIPHASADWIDRCVTALAYLPVAVDFGACDGRPVHTIALVASPPDRRADALLTIERFVRSLQPVGSR
jgi:nitrogen PTS system EIIA component